MRISDWSSDVCSSDLDALVHAHFDLRRIHAGNIGQNHEALLIFADIHPRRPLAGDHVGSIAVLRLQEAVERMTEFFGQAVRSEERRVGQEGGSTCRSRWSPYH